ncbi:MAG: hypothetical protein RIR94_1991 [Bacteroidota bacterium]|jgi:hypothetical protein
MKDPFESKIKSLVEDFSYAYDPKAWDALSKQLPTPKTGLSWLGKFGIASMIAITLGVIGWNLASSQDKKASIAQTKKPATKQENAKHSNPIKENQSKEQVNSLNAAQQTFISPGAIDGNFIQGTMSAPYIDLGISDLTTEGNSTRQFENELSAITTPIPIGTIQQNTPQNLANNQAQTPGTLTNCQGPKIILDADAINYEDGTPRIHISAETMASELIWNVNGAIINRKNKSFDLLAFKGQTYTITAEGQLDGCKTTEKIKITANEDYNLLAVNAFNPQSRDERNATFMPYALTIRDVKFDLVVLDPDNGAVVFKSSDAQNTWDGIDQRNGQMVPAHKAYIWKVVLQETLPGEKSTYTGTIVRI